MGCQLSKRKSRAYQATADVKSGSNQPSRVAASAAKKPKACYAEQQACSSQQQTIAASNTPATAHGKADCKVKAAGAAEPAAKPKPKLDPKDFMLMQLTGQTRVKPPGSVNTQQFIIDDCKGCDLYVMDACAMVTIDDCRDCRIFIGPTESSVFVRNCHNCQLACIARQLRTRDCQDCSLLLRSRTRPIIESSAGISVGCYCTPYAGLAQQMAAVQLSPLHNFWSDVYDFTPAEGTASGAAGGQGSKHWQLLPGGISLEQHMGRLPEQVLQLLHQTEQQDAQEAAVLEQQEQEQQSPKLQGAVQLLTEQDRQSAVYTAGALCSLQDVPERCRAFLLFPPGQHAAVLQWLATQFPCPASSSRLTARQCSNSDRDRDIASITAVDDIIIKECKGTEQRPTAVVAGANTAQLASANGQQQPLLLHTNEAAAPAEILQQIAAAAGWSQAQLKQLSAGHTAAAKGQKQNKQHAWLIGVDVSCGSMEQQAAFCSGTALLGALACSSLEAAKLFRNLGTDG